MVARTRVVSANVHVSFAERTPSPERGDAEVEVGVMHRVRQPVALRVQLLPTAVWAADPGPRHEPWRDVGVRWPVVFVGPGPVLCGFAFAVRVAEQLPDVRLVGD